MSTVNEVKTEVKEKDKKNGKEISNIPKDTEKKISGGINAKNVFLVAGGLIFGLLVGIVLPGLNNIGMQNQISDAITNGGQSIDASDSESQSSSHINAANAVTYEPSSPADFDVEAALVEVPIDDKQAYIDYMVANRGEDPDYLSSRWDLAQMFIESRELRGNAIQGFLQTPREHFVREQNLDRAYADTWMPIGYGATITDPDVVSMMTTTLDIEPGDKVLEIGTGSGYQSTILSFMTDQVYSIEIIEPLFYETNQLYLDLEEEYPSVGNIHRKLGDGFYGWEKYAPFDKIIVTCAIDHVPPPLIQQLTEGGIMVVPLGPPGRQFIMEIKKEVDEQGIITLPRRDVYNGSGVKFIPFRDESGQSYSEPVS